MPSTIELALVVLGAILILISILGGKFKIFGADIEGTTGKFGRIVAFVLGLIFIFIAIIMDDSSSFWDRPIIQPAANSFFIFNDYSCFHSYSCRLNGPIR